MKEFISLFKTLDETSNINLKYEALLIYFKFAPPADSVWALSLLTGRKIKRILSIKKLQEWAIEYTRISQWLFDECFDNVRDLSETIALVLPTPVVSEVISLHDLIETHVIPLKNQSEDIQKERIISTWQKLNSFEKFVFNKLLTGTFHMDVPVKIVFQAFSSFCGLSKSVISLRLSGNWNPSFDYFNLLISQQVDGFESCKPYPFIVPAQFNIKVQEFEVLKNWLIEWKWKGIRSQIVKRDNQIFVWSIEEDFLNDTFSQLFEFGTLIPDGTVIDGIINSDVFIAFDLLEFHSIDLRFKSLSERRELLEQLINSIPDKRIMLSEFVKYRNWDDLKKIKNDSRNNSVDGLILKRFSSQYCVKNHELHNVQWFTWKKDPLYVNAVLLYAQKEEGGTLFKEFTFALWSEMKLIPFAKTSSLGLNEEEKIKIALFIRDNTVEKFGPVRTVKPELIFELEFDGIEKSSRHKSGFLVQSPRISLWHHDKNLNEVNSLNSIIDFINS